MMSDHPVRVQIHQTMTFARVHVIIRLALLLAIGTVGGSSVYWLLYLALPALVGIAVTQKGGDRYLAEDAPRIVRALRWLAGAYAYLWLVTDVLPSTEPGGAVDLDVVAGGRPTATSALARLLYTIPALIVAVVLSLAAGLLWLVGAATVLINQRMPPAISDFLAMALRYQTRLFAYHVSLVDRYPSLEEASPQHVAT
jgi:hypothetical protein